MNPVNHQELIGLSEKDALFLLKKNGITARTKWRNGRPLIATTDYKPFRVNLTVMKDKVIAVKLG